MSLCQAIIGARRAFDWKSAAEINRISGARPVRPPDTRAISRTVSAVDNDPWPREGSREPNMQLILYVRRDCHLCADMHRDLLELGTRLPFAVELVDIDSDVDLVARYGHKVPVLVGGDEEICHYFFDEPQLADYLSRTR